MTYLQLVNKILKRLREDTVSTFDETNYSTFVAELVNQAKDYVEAAWDWTSLLTNITVATNGDGSTYLHSLTGSNEKTKLLRVWDSTNECYIPIVGWGQLEHWRNINQDELTTASTIDMISEYGVASGLLRIAIHRIPTSVVSLKCQVKVPQEELDDGATVLTVPSQPVYLRAYALAVSERGEDGGNLYDEVNKAADDALADAILLDSNNRQSELVWTPN